MASSNASQSRGRVIVIGGSMAGLFTGQLLRLQGWRVDVYERSAANELASRGAGIATHEPLFAALRRVGVQARQTAELGVNCHGRTTFAPDGSTVGTFELQQIMTSWGLLYRQLADVFPNQHYHGSTSLEHVEQDAAGVTAVFANGQRERADWLIGADGVHSTVRAAVAPEVQHEYAGYVAWRGLVDEAALSAPSRRDLIGRLAFSLPHREQMLGYVVAGPDDNLEPGKRCYNWVWYRPAHPETELADLLTDDAGRRYRMSIPPDRIRTELVGAMRDASKALLSPQFVEAVALTQQPFIQPIFDLECRRLVYDRIALLGDAAFVVRPHVGMGVTKAAEDAAALADALAETNNDFAAALALWERPRISFGHAVVKRARQLGAYLQAQLATAEQRRLAEQNRTPEVVMAETAVPKVPVPTD